MPPASKTGFRKFQPRTTAQVVKRTLFENAGNKCSFPGCDIDLISGDVMIGNICHIEALAGARANPNLTYKSPSTLDNLIALCPTHHDLIDRSPEVFTAQKLKQIKADHERNVKKALRAAALTPLDFNAINTVSLRQALEFWGAHRTNAKEEFWQVFFQKNPRLIAQAVPDHIVKLGEKCYVGGKTITNQGGNIADFLYSGRDITIVELKTPATKLVGSQYRTNAYSISEELSGAVVQVLNYRSEFLKHYHAVAAQPSAPVFHIAQPRCLVIAGDIGGEKLNELQNRSFSLFRCNLSGVDILTFDSLFSKIQDLVDMVGE